MSEEILSEFTEELAKRKEPVPHDLVRKYRELGVPESEMAAALLARSALSNPKPPATASETSERRIRERSDQGKTHPGSGASARGSSGSGLWQAVRRLLRIGD